ncbi:MAG: HEAT repeat domain-containing protein [Promethearchaeota archaeon]
MIILVEELFFKDSFKKNLKKLKSKKPEEKLAVLKQIRDSHDTRYIKPLTKILEDLKSPESTDFKRELIITLGILGSPFIVKDLIKMLKDKSAEIREAAAYALGRIGDKVAVPYLINALDDDAFNVRDSAASALARIKDPQAIDILVKKARDPNPEIKLSVIPALGSFVEDERVIDALVENLQDDEPQVRFPAIIAFNKIRSSKAIEPLIKNLESDDPLIQKVAADALTYNLGWGAIKDNKLTKFGERRRNELVRGEDVDKKEKAPADEKTRRIDIRVLVNEIIDLLSLDENQGLKLGNYFNKLSEKYSFFKKSD